MVSFMPLVSATLLLIGTTQAHFNLLLPNTIGFSDDNEGTGPCGSFTPDFTKSNVTDFHVDGDYIFTKSSHPQANFLYRMTLDEKASNGWTQIYPVFMQNGLGNICMPDVKANTSWVGKKAVLGVAASGVDGLLYQCAVVNLVQGTGSKPQDCANGTSVTASFTSDASLNASVGQGGATSKTNAAPGGSQGMEGLYTLLMAGFMVLLI